LLRNPISHLDLSLLVRASGAKAGDCHVVVGFEATAPVEINPDGALACYGEVGTPCRLDAPADGRWHELQGMLTVPGCEEGQELHLTCQCSGASALDLTDLKLVRSVASIHNTGR
jgi:hypothetical protein